jgi:hypothetical protein
MIFANVGDSILLVTWFMVSAAFLAWIVSAWLGTRRHKR